MRLMSMFSYREFCGARQGGGARPDSLSEAAARWVQPMKIVCPSAVQEQIAYRSHPVNGAGSGRSP